MLKTLRSTTKWIMIIVAVCFVGMMVFAWGMDLAGRQSRGGAQAGVVGVINGHKITYNQYNAFLQQRREAMGNQQQFSTDMERRLHEQIWDEMVTQALIDQEIKKRKIGYTDKELVGYMVSNPIQGAFQAPMFKNPDGSFSIEKYRDFITNPDNLKNPETAQIINAIEMQAKGALPVLKLQRKIASGFMVSEFRVREEWIEQNEQRRIEFAWFPADRLIAPDRPVDSKVVEKYYSDHREDFKREELRSLEVVFFPLSATPSDSMEVLNRAKTVAARAKSGDDFAGLADGYSEDPGNKGSNGKGNGGDLGFIQKGRMVKEFEDVAFAMKPGDVSEPFLSRFGWHIVKIDSVKYAEPTAGDIKAGDKKVKAKAKNAPKEVSEVKARHILFKVEPSTRTRDDVESAVNGFLDTVSKKGADFDATVKARKMEPVRTPFFKKTDTYIPYLGGNCSLLLSRVYRAKKGDVLPRYTVDTGFFVLRVAEVKSAGIPALAEVRGEVEAACRKEIGAKAAAEYAARVYERLKSGMILIAAADIDSLKKVAEVRNELVTRSGAVGGLGARHPLVAKAFTLEIPGSNTGVIALPSGAGIAVLVEKIHTDETKFAADKDRLRQQMESDLLNTVTGQFLETLKKHAKIVDNRSEMFQL